MKDKILLNTVIATVLFGSFSAFAGDSTIMYFNLRRGANQFNLTTRSDFVGNTAPFGAGQSYVSFAMDLNADGSVLYLTEFTSGFGHPIYSVDTATGDSVWTGNEVTGPLPDANLSGLSYNPADDQ